MAVLRACPLLPQPLPASSSSSSSTSQSRRPSRGRIAAGALARTAPPPPPRLKSSSRGGARKNLVARRGRLPCLPTKEEVGAVGGAEGEKEEECYLVKESGWGVRRMGRVGEEMRRVALVQAEAFHVPVALFNSFFFNFFKAEVLSALIYRVRNSPPDRYACLVAEEVDATTQLSRAPFEKIVGVVDCTVQDEYDILKHLQGVDEYLYVSGIAVLPSLRRRKVGTALLKACEVLALQWRHKFMALRAYEDDDGARGLYSKAGYRVVSRDPVWVTWVGRRRRVMMIKELPIHNRQIEQQ